MIRIKSISASALKGLDFSHQLAPCTVFTGQNFVGKTARLDAIVLGLAGYHPARGKRNVDTFEFASAPAMGVEIQTDGGITRRVWKQTGDSIKCDIQGIPLAVPPVLIDAKEYFNLSERERVKMVFNLVPIAAGKVKASRIMADLQNIRLEPMTEEATEYMSSLCTDVQVSDQARARDELSVQEWIEELVNDFREHLSKANAALKQNTGAVQSAIEQQARAPLGPMNHNVDAQLETLRKVIQGLRDEAASLGTVVYQSEQSAKTRGLLQESLKETDDLAATLESVTKELTTLRVHKLLGGAAESSAGPIQGAMAKLNADLAGLNAELNAVVHQEKQIEAQFKSEKDLKSCPCCGRSGEAWKKAAKAKYTKLQKATFTAKTELIKKRDAVQVQHDKLATKLTQAKATDTARENLISKKSALEEQRAELQEKLHSRERIMAQLAALPAAVDVQAQANRLTLLKAELEEKSKTEQALLLEQKKNASRIAADLAIATCRRNMASSQMEVDLLKQAVKVVEKVQADLVDSTFTALLGVANEIAGPILRTPLAYHEGNVGRWAGHRFIKAGTFSGTEEALTFAAISIALGASAPIKLVMIDELGRLEPVNRLALIQLMHNLVEKGTIDQFIGADWDTEFHQRFKAQNFQAILCT